MRLVVIALAVVMISASPAFANDHFVAVNEGTGDTATITGIHKEEAAKPGTKISAPTEYQLPLLPNGDVDVCADTSNFITTADLSDCSVATPTLNTLDPTPDDARQQVISYVRSIRLQKPAPTISATNGGICGVVHTVNLHIEDPNPAYYDPDTDFGPMVIRFRGKFTVNWGDGSSNVYYTGGGDYPDNTISHSWTTMGTYDVTVVADWTAQWSLGGFGGTVTGFRTTGALPPFRVYEAQAMLIK